MPRVLPCEWRCSLSGSHDACVALFLSVSPQLGANEVKWSQFGYDLHQEASFYIGGD